MQRKPDLTIYLKRLIMPKNNCWLRRTVLVFAFIVFDYLTTLMFCQIPAEEANPFARAFMESLGIPVGLTLFVAIVNMPIYVTLSLDSNMIKLPRRTTPFAGLFVDAMFAWFVAGTHFSGGTSWFWNVPDLTRQMLGAALYLAFAFSIVRPTRLRE